MKNYYIEATVLYDTPVRVIQKYNRPYDRYLCKTIKAGSSVRLTFKPFGDLVEVPITTRYGILKEKIYTTFRQGELTAFRILEEEVSDKIEFTKEDLEDKLKNINDYYKCEN